MLFILIDPILIQMDTNTCTTLCNTKKNHTYPLFRKTHKTYWISSMMVVCGFKFHSRMFHSYGEVTITCEGLQILTYTRHSWPLSSEGSLACHILWHGASVNDGHLRGPVTLTPIAERLAVEMFDLSLSPPAIEPRSPAWISNTLAKIEHCNKRPDIKKLMHQPCKRS